jgi:hypothetical protein
MPTPTERVTVSPLYTSKQASRVKADLIREWGRDEDGAYRTRNRIDGKDKKAAT